MAVKLTAGSVHTLVVLDGSSGLRVDNLTDAAGSTDRPEGRGGDRVRRGQPRSPGRG